MEAPQAITLAPVKRINGEVTLPGSKSISNRALLLAGLAAGTTSMTNLLKSDDTKYMLKALEQLGVEIHHDVSESAGDKFPLEAPANKMLLVCGNGGLFAAPADNQFSLGNAGTALRPLMAILSLIPGLFSIDGDKYMRERPIQHLAEALEQLGARVEYTNKPGCPPLNIAGGLIKGGEVALQGNLSSQYLSSLLMALPLAEAPSHIKVVGEQVSKPYLDLTLNLMDTFGVKVTRDAYQEFHIPGKQHYQSPGEYFIEGDASAASYFFGAAAIKGGCVKVHGLGRNSIQGDYQFLDTIEQMGARVSRHVHSVEVTRGELHGIDVDLNHIPDAAMTIATMALFAKGSTRIRNIYNWRIKETDRMTAMATELRKLGATVKTGADYMVIDPPKTLNAATLDTYGDHRLAMSLSLAALGEQTIVINNPEVTRKTFPNYFSVFESIVER